MILLVVDTQKGCFDERLYSFEMVRKNIKQLITVARERIILRLYMSSTMMVQVLILTSLLTTMKYMRNLHRDAVKDVLKRM